MPLYQRLSHLTIEKTALTIEKTALTIEKTALTIEKTALTIEKNIKMYLISFLWYNELLKKLRIKIWGSVAKF